MNQTAWDWGLFPLPWRMAWHRCAVAGWAAVLLSLFVPGSSAGGLEPVAEYKIKAVCLYNFLLFTEWPVAGTNTAQTASSLPLVIGIVGQDPFGNAFAEVEGKPVGSHERPLEIRRFGPYRDGQSLCDCHLLFVCRSEEGNRQAILRKLADVPVLTVGDSEGFLRSGGVVCLKRMGDKVRFDINLDAARRAGLKISSHVLRLADSVLESPSKAAP